MKLVNITNLFIENHLYVPNHQKCPVLFRLLKDSTCFAGNLVHLLQKPYSYGCYRRYNGQLSLLGMPVQYQKLSVRVYWASSKASILFLGMENWH